MKILAVDQSYACTGVAIVEDGRPVQWRAIYPKGTKAAKRVSLQGVLNTICFDAPIDLIVIESQWGPSGVSISTSIVDFAFSIGLEIKTLNPRSWKLKMLGSANASKQVAIQVAEELTGVPLTNDNIADSILIGVCAFCHPSMLKKAE